MSTRGVYNQSINYNVVINIINKYIGQEWKNQMRCNIVYTKMEEERTWNLRKAKKWKSRAKKTSRQETPTGFRKKKRTGRSGLEPRTVRLLAKSAYASLAAHAFGIEPDACHITKKRTSRHETPTDSWKKEAKWTLWDSNPGPSGYEPDALTNWAKRPNYTSYLIIVKAIKNDP